MLVAGKCITILTVWSTTVWKQQCIV